MEFDNIETVKRAVEIDAGVSIVPQGTIIQEVAKQTLAAVTLEDGDVLPSAGRHLQKEQSAFAGDETVPGAFSRKRCLDPRLELKAGGKKLPPVFYFRFSRVQRLQIPRQKNAVLANQFAVEPHLAAAPFLALDQHHVPMHRRAVAVVAFLIGLARREMKRPGDFFIEQNIAHRTQNVRIETERKFADVTRPGVGVQNLIQPLRVVRRRLDDLCRP